MRGLFGPGTIILGGVAVLLIGFLAVGVFLPKEWEASAEATIAAAPAELIPLVDSPEAWRRWTAWPDSGLTRSGPDRGPGASISWSDRELGSGSFTIHEVDPAGVDYAVEVEGAGNSVLTTNGEITFTTQPGGTFVRWSESGDLGPNPLMGYWAIAMKRAQSTEMSKGLVRLAAVADSIRSGSAPSR